MNEYAETILRAISGIPMPELQWWSPAMALAVEWLQGQEYITPVPNGRRGGIAYVCTEKGREYLKKFNIEFCGRLAECPIVAA